MNPEKLNPDRDESEEAPQPQDVESTDEVDDALITALGEKGGVEIIKKERKEEDDEPDETIIIFR